METPQVAALFQAGPAFFSEVLGLFEAWTGWKVIGI